MIGPVRTRNRMLKTANGTSFFMEKDQTVGPQMIAWYERLAKGGVGFLVVESSGVEVYRCTTTVCSSSSWCWKGRRRV